MALELLLAEKDREACNNSETMANNIIPAMLMAAYGVKFLGCTDVPSIGNSRQNFMIDGTRSDRM